jgi:hypothetical protein
MQITPSDIVELVEVSAPGYKTLRYWLTFDRPTHLTAKLVKGSGLEEASEEATLIALGEVTPSVAAAAPVVVAKAEPVKAPEPEKIAAPVAKIVEPPVAKTVKAPAPEQVAVAAPTEKTVPTARKIGKGAVEETKVEAVAATMPEPAVAPAPEPAVAEPAPVPEPVKAPEPVAKPEPVPAPAPAKVEPVAEPAIARPAIDKATLTSVVGQHRPEMLKCFAEGKKKMPGMKGTVTLQLQVDAAGKVRAQVQSTLGSPIVAACVIKAANGWKFPARSGGEMANISYPFTIN